MPQVLAGDRIEKITCNIKSSIAFGQSAGFTKHAVRSWYVKAFRKQYTSASTQFKYLVNCGPGGAVDVAEKVSGVGSLHKISIISGNRTEALGPLNRSC